MSGLSLAMGCAAPVADPENPDSPEMKLLIAKTKAAFEVDDLSVVPLLDELYAKVTGLPPGVEERPYGIDGVEYETRRCRYWKVVDSFARSDDVTVELRHNKRLQGYLLLSSKRSEDPDVKTKIDCGKAEGRQVILSQLLEEGIEWAKHLKRASASEARAIAEEYDLLYRSSNKTKLYGLLRESALMEAERREGEKIK